MDIGIIEGIKVLALRILYNPRLQITCEIAVIVIDAVM